MLGKAWGWLTAQLNGKRSSALRLSVHRHAKYESFWRPAETADGRPRVEVQIYLEASNMSAGVYRIAAAEISGVPALETVIGVRDPETGAFAPDNPLPPGRITTLSLHFLVDGQPPSAEEPFSETLVLTDHRGGRHLTKVIMH